MFKTKLYKTLIITLIAVSACSCNKYLDLRPIDGVIREEFWQSKEQLQSAVIGCYTSLLVPSGDRAPAETFFIWGELRADMVSPGIGMSLDENNIVNNNILASNSVTNWRSFYRVINLCNTVLDFGPGVKNVDNTLTDQQLNAYLSEALTIRALMYFYLVRSFGDVPLKLKATSSDNDLVQLAKTPAKAILTQIVADLKLAESYAVATYGNNAYDKGRVTKFTVNALQADVYLWLDNYNEAITACDKIINSGRYALTAGNQAWFNAMYVTGNSIEGIFELQYDQQLLNPYYFMFATVNARYKANPIVIDQFFTVDLLDENNKDVRGIDAAVRVSDQTIYKYVGLDKDNVRSPDISYAHWIVYRYADILLMKAEACANAQRGAEALTLINQIRLRANALPGTAQFPGPEDVAGLTDYILAERAREFAYEGKRWYDLLRNAKRNNYARLDILINAAVRSVPAISQQSAINKLRDPNSHYFPINQYELQTDPNLIQNPFYR
jgi:hypothetical protein